MERLTAVHPHLPRLAQAVTGVLCLEALLFQDPWVVAVPLALVAVARFAPQWSPGQRFLTQPSRSRAW